LSLTTLTEHTEIPLRSKPRPSETTVAAPSDPPRRRGFGLRLGYVIIGVVVAVAAFGWAYVMANVGQTPGIVAQTVAFRVIDDRTVEIDYTVTKPTDRTVRCDLRAVDVNFAEVARVEITVPSGTAHVTGDERLWTSARATSAQVTDCVPV
jgi:uncharacterized protein DUF4307